MHGLAILLPVAVAAMVAGAVALAHDSAAPDEMIANGAPCQTPPSRSVAGASQWSRLTTCARGRRRSWPCRPRGQADHDVPGQQPVVGTLTASRSSCSPPYDASSWSCRRQVPWARAASRKFCMAGKTEPPSSNSRPSGTISARTGRR